MLAIIDWGIGGLSVYKELREKLPDAPVLYMSDTGSTPYGRMSRTALSARLTKVISFLRSKEVSHLVIACNAASTAIPYLGKLEMQILGMIEPAVEMASKSRPELLGIIGGRRTILCGTYRKAFSSESFVVRQRIAQPLSALIEEGDTGSERLRAECRKIMSPLRNCSHILLACTHYPAISGMIRETVSSGTVLLDPAKAVADRIIDWDLPQKGASYFFTTGDGDKMRIAARNAFDIRIGKIENIVSL